jgi:uncharacterized protein YkwD
MHPPRAFCLALALSLTLAGVPRAQTVPLPPAKPSAPAVTALAEAITDLLEQADERIREDDHIRANRLLEGGLRILRGAVADRPDLRKQLSAALAEASREEAASARTAVYRAALVRARRELAPAKGAGAEPKAVVESPREEKGGFRLTREEKALLDLTNKEREKEGLRPLVANVKLFEAARKHSANMARLQRMDHTLDGKGPSERLREVGYKGFGWGENCAAGQRTPAEAVRSWMSSPGHRRNLLSESYGEIGLAVAVGEDGVRYWTQVFGTPARR